MYLTIYFKITKEKLNIFNSFKNKFLTVNSIKVGYIEDVLFNENNIIIQSKIDGAYIDKVKKLLKLNIIDNYEKYI